MENINRILTQALKANGIEVYAWSQEQVEQAVGWWDENIMLNNSLNFNKQLQLQIDGLLSKNHIYHLGLPGSVLLSTGIPNVPIQLRSNRLEVKSGGGKHDYDLSEIMDLVEELNKPIAIFLYGNSDKAQNIIIGITHDNTNFLVGMSLRPSVKGVQLEINSIRNIFPKTNFDWMRWITQDKLLYVDKKRIQTLMDQQRINHADVDLQDLDYVANIINEFENPKFFKHNLSQNDILYSNISYHLSERNVGDANLMVDNGRYILGLALDNKIYLTPEGFNPHTVVREYTHIWAMAMQYGNSEAWSSIKDLLRDTPVWEDVINDPYYEDVKENENHIASEALARVSGKENAVKLTGIFNKMLQKNGEKQFNYNEVYHKLRNALLKFWSWVGKHMFDIQQFYSIGEITDRVLYDLLRGKKLETGKVLHQAPAPTPQDSRISHIQVFRGRGGHPHIRCKVDGVQQMGIPVKPQDLDAVHDKSRLPELAGRYFQNELNRTESHNHTIRL